MNCQYILTEVRIKQSSRQNQHPVRQSSKNTLGQSQLPFLRARSRFVLSNGKSFVRQRRLNGSKSIFKSDESAIAYIRSAQIQVIRSIFLAVLDRSKSILSFPSQKYNGSTLDSQRLSSQLPLLEFLWFSPHFRKILLPRIIVPVEEETRTRAAAQRGRKLSTAAPRAQDSLYGGRRDITYWHPTALLMLIKKGKPSFASLYNAEFEWDKSNFLESRAATKTW